MISGTSQLSEDANEEVSALVKTLLETGQRLEELTAGEVDSVADRDGRTFLLRRAQEQLRHSETARQGAILDALPAHIALLDTQGRIVSVNTAWRQFNCANGLQSPGYAVGVNYLGICDKVQGDEAAEAHQAAEGIRSVLDGRAKSFSLEYPCHSPTDRHWFLLTVTPLADDRLNGAVVMHVDITAERQNKESLRASELRFRQMAENIRDVFFLIDAASNRALYISPAYEEIWGRTCESVYANAEEWTNAIHPDDQASTYEKYRAGMAVGRFEYEYRIVRPDGSIRHIEVRGFPVRDDAGKIVRIAGVAEDITQRKLAAQELRESERRFNDMLDNVQLVSVMVDRRARITYCNEYLLRLTGWKYEEVIGRDWFELFVPPENIDLQIVRAALLANLPEAWHHENEILTRSGERRLIRWNNSVLRSVDGEVIGTASIGEDITERKMQQESLRQNEERTRLIIESALDAVVVMDAEGRITDWNTQAEKTFGWSREEVIGIPLAETIVPAKYREAHAQGLRVFLETGEGSILNRRIEVSAMHRDGHEFPVALTISPVSVGESWIFSSFIRDLTDWKQSANKITRLNRVYAVLSGINAVIMRVRDRDELFNEACRIAVDNGRFRMAWIAVVDRANMNLVPVASAGTTPEFLEFIKQRSTLRQDAPDGNTLVARAIREKKTTFSNDVQNDPNVVFKEEHAQRGSRSMAVLPLQVSDEVVGALALYSESAGFFDDEELKLLTELAGNIAFAIDNIDKQKRLDYLAYYDALTGLANRSLFLERVAQYMRSAVSGGHRLALFLIDLERFKNINDSLGRPAGDALLRQVAEWLTRIAGDANLVARVGADDFALVLPEVKKEGNVTQFLEKSMRAFLEHPFRLNDAVFRVAVKAGVALFPDDGADADTLFKNAEAALKKAKASGDRYLFYTQTMTQSVAGKLTLENQLRQALEKKEFVLHYQPKVNLVSGKLTGAEALIRWNDPLTGLVPPGRFIPVLEETGLIYEVGRWALHQALADYLRWRNAGLPAVRIAVNVSPLQLRHRGFITGIEQVIGIDAQAAAGLELEITESLIMEDVKHNIASLQAIRALGVMIAIDDFGTGFSSLSYLSKLPVDTLKIDRSFVVDMTAGPEGLALVSTIINLAHSLKLNVVAEGVETEEQSRLLRLLGCDEMQGFLFGKPVPCEIFESRYLASPLIRETASNSSDLPFTP